MSERRQYRRRKTDGLAMMKSRWLLVNATLEDASVAGFQIASDADFSVGDEVELAVDLPGADRVHCDGLIVRDRSRRRRTGHPGSCGYGIRISRINKGEHDKLRSWMRSSRATATHGFRPDRSEELQEFAVRIRGAG